MNPKSFGQFLSVTPQDRIVRAAQIKLVARRCGERNALLYASKRGVNYMVAYLAVRGFA